MSESMLEPKKQEIGKPELSVDAGQRLAVKNRVWGGVAIFVGAVQFGVLLIVAEALYPGYSVSANAISDLGAACNAAYVCTVTQPSSSIFNGSLIFLGLFLLVGAYFLVKGRLWRPLVVSVALAGLGAVGVGVFPESAGPVHGVVSLIAFLFSAIAAILSFRVVRFPLKQISVVLGLMSLAAIVMFLSQTYLGLGLGGMERMILYPALLWYVGFSGALMERNSAL